MSTLALVPASDDQRLGQLLRLLRMRSGKRQKDLAIEAGVPRGDVIKIEAGQGGEVALDRTRRLVEAAGGRAWLTVWYNGAAADRLLDERHARLVERAVALFLRRGWHAESEVTFSEYGERGSIDLLAGHRSTLAAAVCEIKSEFGSLEDLNRSLDVKERLAPKIVRRRFGWTPVSISRILIVPDNSTMRRVVARHEATMRALYPARSREVRAWLREPGEAIRAIWFLSEVAASDRIPR